MNLLRLKLPLEPARVDAATAEKLVSLSFGWCLWKEGTANFDRAPGPSYYQNTSGKRQGNPARHGVRCRPHVHHEETVSRPGPGWQWHGSCGCGRRFSGLNSQRGQMFADAPALYASETTSFPALRRVNVTATSDGCQLGGAITFRSFTSRRRTARSSRMLPSTAASSALARWSPQPIVSAQYSTGRDGLAAIGASTFIRRGEGTSMAACGRRGGRGSYRPPAPALDHDAFVFEMAWVG